MSKEKEKKIQLKCTLCGAKVSLTPEELKKSKNFDNYIVRHGFDATTTAVQAGTLCDDCLAKPLEKRIAVKR